MFCCENNRCVRFYLVVSCTLTILLSALAGAQITPLPASEVNRRVDTLLGSMTTEEKIKLLGGTEGMYTTPLPRLGIPALRMSDGPVGVHVFGPTTAYPAGIHSCLDRSQRKSLSSCSVHSCFFAQLNQRPT